MFWAHCTWKSYKPLLNIYLKKTSVFALLFAENQTWQVSTYVRIFIYIVIIVCFVFFFRSQAWTNMSSFYQHIHMLKPRRKKKVKLMKYIYFFESLIYGWSSVVECSGKFETFPMIWFQKVKTPTWSEGFHLLRGLCRVTEGRWVRFDPLSNVKHENDNIYI